MYSIVAQLHRQLIKAFMMSKTSVPTTALGYYPTVPPINTQKLRSLLISVMGAVYESLPGKHLAC